MKTVLALTLTLSLVMSYCFADTPSIFKANKCSSPEISDMKFSLTSYRNQTGHWIAQVQFQHGGELGKQGSDHHENGKWHVDVDQTTAKCGDSYSVQLVATVTGPASASPPRPGPGYELFPQVGYYKFHHEGGTWDEARRVCENEGAHLAIINSEAESKVLQQLFSRVPKLQNVDHNEYIFLGFHDRFVEGEQVTIFGAPIQSTGFTRWVGPGQPDNAGGIENCGSMNRGNGGLNDIPCQWRLGYICEQELW